MLERKRWSVEDNAKLKEAFDKHPNNKEVAISSAANQLKRTENAVGLQWRRLSGAPVRTKTTPPASNPKVARTKMMSKLMAYIVNSVTPSSVITVSKGEAVIKF